MNDAPSLRRRLLRTMAALGLAGAAAGAPDPVGAQTAGSAAPPAGVRSTILPGTLPPTPTRAVAPVTALANGDLSFNFPAADVRVVSQAVLGDTLGLRFTLDPSAHGPVTLLTSHPIRKADVLTLFEQALAASGFALFDRGGVYTVATIAAARTQAPVVETGASGFGEETIALKFVNADELRKLLDPLVPGAITGVDAAQNALLVSGSTVQRRALRELVAQFDVNWLRGMSFALYVPQKTDARLIAPELNKLLNGPGAPTSGLVRLITMDQLNGILAISAQPQYLEDTRRFVEVLDREGESAEPKLFVYHVQNGRAADLARVLNQAFHLAGASAGPPGATAPTGIEPTDLQDTSSPSPNSVASRFAAPATLGAVGGAAAALTQGANAREQTRELARAAAGGGPASEGVTITADETNNALLVYGTPRGYALIEDALRRLDTPPLQVLIDASISEVTLNHDLQYGIQWRFGPPGDNAALTQGKTFIPQRVFPGLSYLYAGDNVRATLNALSKITDVNVLSAPKLMVLNNHTATINVGDQVPISTGSAVSTEGGGAPIVNSIDYRDTGIILKVTPRVNAGGLVLLDIAQEVSDVSNTSTSSLDSPTIQQRKIATSVAVGDGETIALGGLIKNQVSRTRSTIPLLGEIPVLGHLFGDTGKALVRTELVVLLTPHVVATPVDARAITAELRSKLVEAEPPPPPSKPTAHARPPRP